MYTAFIVMFGVGLGFAVISFLFGEVLSAIDVDGDFSTGGTVSPLKPSVIAAFITVFGGTGIILVGLDVPMLTVIPLAGVAGAGVAFLFFRFVIVPLSKAQNTSAVEIQSLIGHPAKVSVKIPQGQFGRITYKVNGNTYSAPAKAEDGKEILRSVPVEIVYIANSTYFVKQSA